jgi:hypothetical protein
MPNLNEDNRRRETAALGHHINPHMEIVWHSHHSKKNAPQDALDEEVLRAQKRTETLHEIAMGRQSIKRDE